MFSKYLCIFLTNNYLSQEVVIVIHLTGYNFLNKYLTSEQY